MKGQAALAKEWYKTHKGSYKSNPSKKRSSKRSYEQMKKQKQEKEKWDGKQ